MKVLAEETAQFLNIHQIKQINTFYHLTKEIIIQKQSAIF